MVLRKRVIRRVVRRKKKDVEPEEDAVLNEKTENDDGEAELGEEVASKLQGLMASLGSANLQLFEKQKRIAGGLEKGKITYAPDDEDSTCSEISCLEDNDMTEPQQPIPLKTTVKRRKAEPSAKPTKKKSLKKKTPIAAPVAPAEVTKAPKKQQRITKKVRSLPKGGLFAPNDDDWD